MNLESGSTSPELGFLFPGQGSQSVGMLGDLAEHYSLVRETFDEAAEELGLDIWRLVSQGPEADLNLTRNTQPAMLCAGFSAWRVWLAEGGPRPACVAGHSLGEYTALVCAGAMSFRDAVRIVARRGLFMQEAVAQGSGAMAAVLGLDDEAVSSLCLQVAENQVVEAVNFNAPGQVVVAGERAAVERVIEAARAAGAKRSLLLPVSVPSHCRLMEPAARRLRDELDRIALKQPEIPVVHNVTADVCADAGELRGLLARQLYSPVRWVETVKSMAARGVGHVVECGPGKVLTGLTKRIDPALRAFAVFDSKSLSSALETIGHA